MFDTIIMFFTTLLLLLASPISIKNQQRSFQYSKTIFQKVVENMEKIKYIRSSTQNQKLVTKWIEQPLDHFNSADDRTFKMRFLEDRTFWKPNSPIFIFIGGESAVSDAVSSLLVYEIAEETNGLMIATEHRYYGESLPRLNLNLTANLKYLNSQQALADLAFLIKRIKSYPETSRSMVIVSGCSYGANLAVWMKVVYPSLVHGAVASSAPVLAKKNNYHYVDVAGHNFKRYGLEHCYETIQKIFKRYEVLLKSFAGMSILKNEENICSSVDMRIPENRQHFFFTKMSALMATAQFGTPLEYQWNCSQLMMHGRIQSPDFVHPSEGCNDHDFIGYIVDEFMSYSFTRLWLYQTCTEFGNFVNSDSGDNPFTKNFPLDFQLKKCFYAFGPEFNEQRADEGIEKTNRLYGGQEPRVQNVIFVNGAADPWGPLCVQKRLPGNRLVLIPDAHHCADLYYINDQDTPQVKKAKKFVKYLVKTWLLRSRNYFDGS